MPCARNNAIIRNSVSRLPRPRMRDITSERFSTVKTSGICFEKAFQKAKLWLCWRAHQQCAVEQAITGLAAGLRKQTTTVARGEVRVVSALTVTLDADRIG